MANIKIPRETFEKEISQLNQQMQEKIILFGTPLKNINDTEIELEIFPNRPDLLSFQGFKRSFLSFLGKEKGIKEYKINPLQKEYKVIIDSSLKDIRPNTTCAVIKNIKLNNEKIKEIIEIQEKLHATIGRKRKKLAIGIYPLEKITFPITFKALEPDKIKFIPLDYEKEISGLEILRKHPTGKEYAHLLAGKIRFPIFIDSKNKILSMPPIINSQETGKVTTQTKDLFIECSGFDQEILSKCLNIIVTMLSDMGGEIYPVNVNNQTTPNFIPKITQISLENTNKLLGLNLSEKELEENLQKMGHEYKKNQAKTPAWRTDILHEVDLIEDVAIAYGYEKFTPEIPKISTIGQEDPFEVYKNKITQILVGLGLLEVSNYHLTKKDDQIKKMNLQKEQESYIVQIEKSKTDYNLLRINLSHNLLKNHSENSDSIYPQNIFEVGKVFKKDKQDYILEQENLAISLIPGEFTKLKQILQYLFQSIDQEIKINEPKIPPPNHLIEGRTAQISIKDEIIGFFGEVHPKILKNWNIKMPVAILELNLKQIFESNKQFQAPAED